MFYPVSIETVSQDFEDNGWSVAPLWEDGMNVGINLVKWVSLPHEDMVHRLTIRLRHTGEYDFLEEGIDMSTRDMVSYPVRMNLPDFIMAQNIITGAMSVRYTTGAQEGVAELNRLSDNPDRTSYVLDTLVNIIVSCGLGWEEAPARGNNRKLVRLRSRDYIETLYLYNTGPLVCKLETRDVNTECLCDNFQSPSLTMTMCAFWNAYIRLMGSTYGDLVLSNEPIPVDRNVPLVTPSRLIPQPMPVMPNYPTPPYDFGVEDHPVRFMTQHNTANVIHPAETPFDYRMNQRNTEYVYTHNGPEDIQTIQLPPDDFYPYDLPMRDYTNYARFVEYGENPPPQPEVSNMAEILENALHRLDRALNIRPVENSHDETEV